MRKNSAPKQRVAGSAQATETAEKQALRRRAVQTKPASKTKYAKVNLSIPHGLLEQVDETAKREFTTRSDIIRQSLLLYIWPAGLHGIHGARTKQTPALDLDELLASLKKRQLQAHLKRNMKNRKSGTKI